MWVKRNGKQERETLWWDETVESLVKHKRKLRKEVAEMRQQRKIFEGKKEKQNQVYMLLKEKPKKKNLASKKAVPTRISFSNQQKERSMKIKILLVKNI